MDENLKLHVIELGFDALNAKEIGMQEAGQHVVDEYLKSLKIGSSPGFSLSDVVINGPASGMVLFDGHSNLEIQSNSVESESGENVRIQVIGHKHQNLSIEGDYLAITSVYGDGTMRIRSIKDQEDVTLGEYKKNFVIAPQIMEDNNQLVFDIKYQESQNKTRLTFQKLDDTKVLYIPKIDTQESNKIFWGYLAEKFGLKLTQIPPPKTHVPYGDLSSVAFPWYTTTNETGIRFELGTNSSGNYIFTVEFPEKKSKTQFQEIIDGLDIVNPSIDGKYVYYGKVQNSGKTIHGCFHRWESGYQILDLMTRTLG